MGSRWLLRFGSLLSFNDPQLFDPALNALVPASDLLDRPNLFLGWGLKKAYTIRVEHSCISYASHLDPALLFQIVFGSAKRRDLDLQIISNAFDYVALGHLHSPQKVGRDAVRYCGTPLKYSFSEADQHKSATFVEFGLKGEVSITTAPLTPKHDLREVRGSYMELTDRRNYDGTAVDDYLHITLTDEQDVPDALARLRVIYPNLMRLDYDNLRTREDQEITAPERAESITPLEHFSAFYQLQNNQPLTAEQAAFCQQLIEEIWKEGEDA